MEEYCVLAVETSMWRTRLISGGIMFTHTREFELVPLGDWAFELAYQGEWSALLPLDMETIEIA